MTGAAEIVPYDFRGVRLDVVHLPEQNDVGVSFRRLCEAIPVDFSSQLQRVRRSAGRGIRWAKLLTVITRDDRGYTREMLVLPRRSIPMFAATVLLTRVREDLRPGATEKLARLQDECAEVLADHFLGPRRPLGSAPVVEAFSPAVEARIAALEARLVEQAAQLRLLSLEGRASELHGVADEDRAMRAGAPAANDVVRPHRTRAEFGEKLSIAFELMSLGASKLAAAKGVDISPLTLNKALGELHARDVPLPPANLASPLPTRALPKLKRQYLRRKLKASGWRGSDITSVFFALGERLDDAPLDVLLHEATAARDRLLSRVVAPPSAPALPAPKVEGDPRVAEWYPVVAAHVAAKPQGARVTIGEVLVFAFGVPHERHEREAQSRVGVCLARAGWVVAGRSAWGKRERFYRREAEVSEDTSATYQQMCDFLTQRVYGGEIRATDLYREYRVWAAANGHEVMSIHLFGRRIGWSDVYVKRRDQGGAVYRRMKLLPVPEVDESSHAPDATGPNE